MKTSFVLSLICTFLFSTSTFADEKNTSGAHIYKEVCSVCHSSGVANAPKLGDQNDWKKLIAEGQVIITAHGYVGVRAMPPKGGRQDLSVEQFSEALNYMVNKSGGNWSAPDKSMLDKINKEIANRTKTQ